LNINAIEPLKALGIELVQYEKGRALFKVPLIGNRNDKGTLFAGSQYSALVLSGWYLTSNWASENDLGEKVAVKDSNANYPKAALSDLLVEAVFDTEPDKRPSGHWRAKVTVTAKDVAGDIVSKLSADYRILQA